jgi:uncharacterized protein YcaQ
MYLRARLPSAVDTTAITVTRGRGLCTRLQAVTRGGRRDRGNFAARTAGRRGYDPAMNITDDHLRRYAVARSLFRPTTLGRAITKLGFVQADPIRAPARAQDLILRHRVCDYRAGDLERRYPSLGLEEDFFVNYGFLPRASSELMHPRVPARPWPSRRHIRAEAVLAFVRERGAVHPREVDAHFAHGKETNWFGGSSNASTRLLDEMHYRGWLRVVRRVAGTRVYAVRSNTGIRPDEAAADSRMDALVDLIVNKYAPLPANGLGHLLSLLCSGVPQWAHQRGTALARAKQRLGQARVGGTTWYWPVAENPTSRRWQVADEVRLLTPFDPIVHDRRRFEHFWGWAYRFEAYTPASKRKLGYYALPLLWRDRVVGWGNVAFSNGALKCSFGYIEPRQPREIAFRERLDAELERMRWFLSADGD